VAFNAVFYMALDRLGADEEHDSDEKVSLWLGVTVLVAGLVASFLPGQPSVWRAMLGISGEVFVRLLLFGLFYGAGYYIAHLVAFRHLKVEVASPLAQLELLTAMIGEYMVLHALPGRVAWLGAVFVVVAAAGLVRAKVKKE
jgi:drug/metabolite transporter (DMT)-like permease